MRHIGAAKSLQPGTHRAGHYGDTLPYLKLKTKFTGLTGLFLTCTS